jgi:hypothetical protein
VAALTRAQLPSLELDREKAHFARKRFRPSRVSHEHDPSAGNVVFRMRQRIVNISSILRRKNAEFQWQSRAREFRAGESRAGAPM